MLNKSFSPSYIFHLTVYVTSKTNRNNEIKIQMYITVLDANKTLCEIKDAIINSIKICAADPAHILGPTFPCQLTINKSIIPDWSSSSPAAIPSGHISLSVVNNDSILDLVKLEMQSPSSFSDVGTQMDSPESMMFVSGDNFDAARLYDNWCTTDEMLFGDFVNWPLEVDNVSTAESRRFYEKDLNFVLVPGYLMPVQTIRVTIEEPKLMQDMYGNNYTAYKMTVRQGGLEWCVERRFSGTVVRCLYATNVSLF
jgi:hypothetical protein